MQKTPLGEIRVLFETTNPVPNAFSRISGRSPSRSQALPAAVRELVVARLADPARTTLPVVRSRATLAAVFHFCPLPFASCLLPLLSASCLI